MPVFRPLIHFGYPPRLPRTGEAVTTTTIHTMAHTSTMSDERKIIVASINRGGAGAVE